MHYQPDSFLSVPFKCSMTQAQEEEYEETAVEKVSTID